MPDQLIRVLFFADTHLGFDFPLKPRVERQRRGQGFFDNFQRILDYAERTRPDLVVHGGDLFFRSRVPPRIVDMVYESLMRFSASGIPLFIVPGNHERSKLPSSLWLAAPNIHVFDVPRTFELTLAGTTTAVSGFPFERDDVRNRFRSILTETGWDRTPAPVKLLCMHQAIEGAQFGPANFTFRSGNDVVRLSDIPQDCTAVLTGHIHRQQVLRAYGAMAEVPIIYAGSIERTSFAEKDEPKGFFELTISPSAPAKRPVSDLRFVPLPTRPMVDIAIDPAIDHSELRAYLVEKSATLQEDSIVRIKSAGVPEERLRQQLTAPFLRSVFPPSMSIVLGREFFDATKNT